MDTDPPGPHARPSGPSGTSSYGSSSPSDATWQRPSQATNQYPPQTAPPLDPQARNQIYSDRLNEYRARRFHEHSRHRPPRSSHRPRSLLHALATAPSHSAPQVFFSHEPLGMIFVIRGKIPTRSPCYARATPKKPILTRRDYNFSRACSLDGWFGVSESKAVDLSLRPCHGEGRIERLRRMRLYGKKAEQGPKIQTTSS